jgi:Hemolysin coregulated protein Hcp (TssD)
VESTGTTDVFEWMISAVQTKNGEVTFYRRDNMSKLKTLIFSEGHCVDYYESFDHNGAHPMQITFTISAKELKLNDSQFLNNWPE